MASARPFEIAWARAAIAQCRAAGVACFIKQLGSRPLFTYDDVPDSLWSDADANGYQHDEIARAARQGRLRFRDRKGGDPAEWPEDLRVREWPVMTRGIT